MDKLQTNIIQHIYEYDNTYKIESGKVFISDEDALLYL